MDSLRRMAALALCVALCLPSPALALRQTGLEENQEQRQKLSLALTGAEEPGANQVLQIHRELFSLDPPRARTEMDQGALIRRYRDRMGRLSRLVEPGHPVDGNTLFFVRIGKDLRLGDPRGSVTNQLFNNVFRKLGINAAMVPVDFNLIEQPEEAKQVYYRNLTSLIFDDPKTVGFAAGYPMKGWTPEAVRAWAERRRANQEDIQKVLTRMVAGGVRKIRRMDSEGLSALDGDKLAMTSLMTSGEAWVMALESDFPKDTVQATEKKAFTIIGADGETAREIVEALAQKPYVGHLDLVEHTAKISALNRLKEDLLQKHLGLSVQASVSGEKRGPAEKPPRFVLDGTPSGTNPIREENLQKSSEGKKPVYFSLGYRPDPYAGLRPAALSGAEVHNGVNLLITDNLRQIRGILLSLGYPAEEADRLSQEVVEPSIRDFLSSRGLESSSLTGEIAVEAALRQQLQKRLPTEIQEGLVPDQIVKLLLQTEADARPTLCCLVREDKTVLALLGPDGKRYPGTEPVKLSPVDPLSPDRFFSDLLRTANDRLLKPQGLAGKDLRGIAVAVVGNLKENGVLSPTIVKPLEGVNVAQKLSEAADSMGVEGPVRVVNDTRAAIWGVEESLVPPVLHFIIRSTLGPGGIGGALWDGRHWANLEPTLFQVEYAAGSHSLGEVAAAPEIVEMARRYAQETDSDKRGQIRSELGGRIRPLVEVMVRLADQHRVDRISVTGDLADLPVYQELLQEGLRRRGSPYRKIDLQVMADDEMGSLRGAQRFLQPDAEALLTGLLAVAADGGQPPAMRAFALRVLREVLRSEPLLQALRQRTGERFSDDVRQAVLQLAREITRHPVSQGSDGLDLLQQVVFTLGALGHASDLGRLVEMEKHPSAKITGSARFSRDELEQRLKQEPVVVSLLLRRDLLARNTLSGAVVKGGTLQSPIRSITLTGKENTAELIGRLAETVLSLAHEHNLGYYSIAGVGLAMGADLDPAREAVVKSYYFESALPPRTPVQWLLEEELRRISRGEIPLPGPANETVYPEYRMPVSMIHDEEVLAMAEARYGVREGVYIHVGADVPRVWVLHQGSARAVNLAPGLAQELSGKNFAQKAAEVIRAEAGNRNVTVSELAAQEPVIAHILEAAPGKSPEESLKNLTSVTELGQAFQPGPDQAAAERIFGSLWREFARQMAAAIDDLRQTEGARTFILGGGVIFHNDFLLNEFIPDALQARGILQQVSMVRQRVHPGQEGIVPTVVAQYVGERLRLPGVSSGGALQEVRNMRVAAFEPSGEVSGPLTRAAREMFERLAREAIRDRGQFVVALSGGRTPRLLYRLLASSPDVDWRKVQIFSADERKVSPGGPGIGYQVVKENLLDLLPGPKPHVHRINVDLEDPEQAAREYENQIRRVLGADQRFDLMIIGAGADRHILSLRAGSRLFSKPETEMGLVEVIQHPEAVNQVGYTLTPPVLRQAKQVLLLLTGEEKQDVLKELMEGKGEISQSPIHLVDQLPAGVAAVFTDLALPGAETPPVSAGMEEVVSLLRTDAPPAAVQGTPLRFLADTYRGDARVLHLLQLAVLLNLRRGMPIQAAGVATEEEAARAIAQLPPEARDLFRQLVATYREGDAADYQFARAVAEGMIPGFHPELVITTVEDPAVIGWFFEALRELGITELTSDLEGRIYSILQAA